MENVIISIECNFCSFIKALTEVRLLACESIDISTLCIKHSSPLCSSGCDRMVVGYTTTYATSAYYH
jgi:hypothetical protein